MTCDCGAASGELGLCEDAYHAILAEEQTDPLMYAWHTPVVCAYFLQHPTRGAAHHLDGQFRLLQLYVAEGIEAVHRVSALRVAANRRGAPPPVEGFLPLPSGVPGRFGSSFSGLPGVLLAGGYEAYGRRIQEIAEATVRGYLV